MAIRNCGCPNFDDTPIRNCPVFRIPPRELNSFDPSGLVTTFSKNAAVRAPPIVTFPVVSAVFAMLIARLPAFPTGPSKPRDTISAPLRSPLKSQARFPQVVHAGVTGKCARNCVDIRAGVEILLARNPQHSHRPAPSRPSDSHRTPRSAPRSQRRTPPAPRRTRAAPATGSTAFHRPRPRTGRSLRGARSGVTGIGLNHLPRMPRAEAQLTGLRPRRVDPVHRIVTHIAVTAQPLRIERILHQRIGLEEAAHGRIVPSARRSRRGRRPGDCR